jgi:hypothetical protein
MGSRGRPVLKDGGGAGPPSPQNQNTNQSPNHNPYIQNLMNAYGQSTYVGTEPPQNQNTSQQSSNSNHTPSITHNIGNNETIGVFGTMPHIVDTRLVNTSLNPNRVLYNNRENMNIPQGPSERASPEETRSMLLAGFRSSGLTQNLVVEQLTRDPQLFYNFMGIQNTPANNSQTSATQPTRNSQTSTTQPTRNSQTSTTQPTSNPPTHPQNFP